MLALHRFLFATTYILDQRGIESRGVFGRRRVLWTQVRELRTDAHGGYIVTENRRRRFSRPKGLFVLFDDQRPARTAAIRSAINHAASADTAESATNAND